MRYHIEVDVERWPTNETEGNSWVPTPQYVAAQIEYYMKELDLHTGWKIVHVEPSKRLEQLEAETGYW